MHINSYLSMFPTTQDEKQSKETILFKLLTVMYKVDEKLKLIQL